MPVSLLAPLGAGLGCHESSLPRYGQGPLGTAALGVTQAGRVLATRSCHSGPC